MTRTEAAALDELHMTPEQLAERTAKMEQLAQLGTPVPAPIEPSRTRKPRSDKGKPKPKKPEPIAQAGTLTNGQADELRDLASLIYEAKEDERLACDAYQEACIKTSHAMDNFNNRLAALAAK